MQILLCGTGYGASYLEALTQGGSGFRLAGILARGSERSRSLARTHGVPFYRTPEDVAPGAIDAACVAISGPPGEALVHAFLERGVHVLVEHPQTPEAVEGFLASAQAHHAVLHINGHVGDIETAATFVNAAVNARHRNAPFFITGILNPRTLYGGLDLLARALGTLEPFSFAPATSQRPPKEGARSPFISLQGQLAGVSTTLHCQSSTSRHDDGTGTHLNHQLTLCFPEGTLQLADTYGPALWLPVQHPSTPWSVPAWTALTAPMSLHQGHQSRSTANHLALRRFSAHIESGTSPKEQTPKRLREVSQAWQAAINSLGPFHVIDSTS